LNFLYSEKNKKLKKELIEFMEEYVYPNEKTYENQLNEPSSRWIV
jgi:acyl-CoA dehydrogenase